MTAAELAAAAWLELTKTTDSYPKWKQRGFPVNTHWGAAKNYLDQIVGGVVPPPPPPPPGGLSVDPTTMLAVGGRILRDDSSSQADPLPGLWGELGAVSSSRCQFVTSGGDPHPKADGTSQGNSNYRSLTVNDGDDFFGERCELGRNKRESGENTGTQTSGTFALYNEGDHKITFFSMRFSTGFTAAKNNWQVICQHKQAQSYVANGPVNTAPAFTLQVWGNMLRLDNFWAYKWTCPVPANNVWFRVAMDVVYSKDPSVGKIKVYVDSDGDGVADYVSPLITMQTLATCTSAGNGLAVGDPIPGHLRMGIYHDASAYGTTTVHLDNVQVVG